MTSPRNTPELETRELDKHLDPKSLALLFTSTYTGPLKVLEDLQKASATNKRSSGRISLFLDAAGVAIKAITELKTLIVTANDSEEVTSREDEEAIDMASLNALTALNDMFTLLVPQGPWYKSPAGIAAQDLSNGVSRYLGYVKAEHIPVEYDTDGDYEDDGGEDGDEEEDPVVVD